MNFDATTFQAACHWVKFTEQKILAGGRALAPDEKKLALEAGVEHPERVRILVVDEITPPDHPVLSSLAAATGLTSPNNVAQTFQYGIVIRADMAQSSNLLRHELTHVAQYERLGGVAGFLERYLQEIMKVGYDAAPLEEEARRAEQPE